MSFRGQGKWVVGNIEAQSLLIIALNENAHLLFDIQVTHMIVKTCSSAAHTILQYCRSIVTIGFTVVPRMQVYLR